MNACYVRRGANPGALIAEFPMKYGITSKKLNEVWGVRLVALEGVKHGRQLETIRGHTPARRWEQEFDILRIFLVNRLRYWRVIAKISDAGFIFV